MVETLLDEPCDPAPAEEEELSIHVLYHDTLRSISTLPRINDCQQCVSGNAKVAVQQSVGHLYLWAQGLDLRFLESYIPRNTKLQETIITKLAGIMKVVRELSGRSEHDDVQAPVMDKIEALLKKYKCHVDLDECETNSSSDEDISADDHGDDKTMVPTAPSMPQTAKVHRKHRELVQQLGLHVRCLMDLIPILEQYHDEHLHRDPDYEAPFPVVEDESLTTVHPYIMQIKDKFNSISGSLATRLGEANWSRFRRLQTLDRSNEADSTPVSVHTHTLNTSLTAPTFVPISEFQDSGLGASLPAKSRYASSVASHTSMFSSQSAQSRGAIRVPPTPAAVEQGLSFHCPICLKVLHGVRNRIDWKMHVFADIRPYICTFEHCDQSKMTFPTRNSWADHEFNKHRTREVWRCVHCKEDYPTSASLREHFEGVHLTETSMQLSEISIMLDASKRLQINASALKCTMCCRTEFNTRREWTTHVCRHLEEVALVVLPRDIQSDDDDADTNEEKAEEEEEEGKEVQHFVDPSQSRSRQTVSASLVSEPQQIHVMAAGHSTDESNDLAQFRSEKRRLSNGLIAPTIVDTADDVSEASSAEVAETGIELGDGGSEFTFDPTTDPELALALHMSIQEEQERLDKERDRLKEKEKWLIMEQERLRMEEDLLGLSDDSEDELRYCVCNRRSYGEMVACKNDDCPYQWFHTGCLNMKKIPNEDEDWYCPICRVKPGIIEKTLLPPQQTHSNQDRQSLSQQTWNEWILTGRSSSEIGQPSRSLPFSIFPVESELLSVYQTHHGPVTNIDDYKAGSKNVDQDEVTIQDSAAMPIPSITTSSTPLEPIHSDPRHTSTLDSAPEIKGNVLNAAGESTPSYSCRYCSETFTKASDFDRHLDVHASRIYPGGTKHRRKNFNL